jgi:hypothetical protein
MLMVDDFYVGPESQLYDSANAPAKHARRVSRRSQSNLNEHFNIYLDNTKVAQTDATSYVIENVSAGTHDVAVESVYKVSNGGSAHASIDVPAASSYHSLTVSAHNKLNAELKIKLTVISMSSDQAVTIDGVTLAKIPYLAAGEYSINVEADGYADYTQTINITEDTTLNLLLEESNDAPYNLAFDAETLTLTWNSDLGFSDGFEDYADFSQKFGDWTVVDGDQMPTYAIGIGGDMTLLTTPETRGLVGAMIFNPAKTEPVKASEDGLFIAPEGDKYVMFNSAEQAVSDDWLISPIQTIGDNYVVRFTAKSYSSTYPGRYELGVMTDPKNTATFTALDAMDLPAEWARYELSLSAYAGEKIAFAFHHTSSDQWISFVDDFYIGPESTESAANDETSAQSYKVYLDGAQVGEVNECRYTFDTLTPGDHVLGVRAVYQTGESATTTLNVTLGSAVRDITVNQMADESVLYDLSGRRVIGEPAPGVYIKRRGGVSTKHIVK